MWTYIKHIDILQGQKHDMVLKTYQVALSHRTGVISQMEGKTLRVVWYNILIIYTVFHILQEIYCLRFHFFYFDRSIRVYPVAFTLELF